MTETYFDHAPCLFFSTADDGTILQVNDRLCAALQYTREELTGKKAELFYTVPTKIFQQTHFFPLLKMQGHAEEIFITLKAKDGSELPALINAERKLSDNRFVNLYAGIVVYNRKKFEEELITAKKLAEKTLADNTELAEAKNELQRKTEELDLRIYLANKQNEELRQFNRVVTHDMQEPIRKLTVFANMLPEENLSLEQTLLLQKLKRITATMKNLLSGLQQYVWLTDNGLVIGEVNLSKTLLMVQEQLKREFPGVQLTIRQKNLQPFSADSEQMPLLFYQLLSNVIRFRKNKDQATATISTDTIQLNQFRNVEGKYKYIDFVRIKVEDEGVGFDPQYKSKVFDLFKKLHAESGQGIGLALCKKIAENHQGSISIESTAGKGTIVTILLPQHPLVTGSANSAAEKTSETVNL